MYWSLDLGERIPKMLPSEQTCRSRRNWRSKRHPSGCGYIFQRRTVIVLLFQENGSVISPEVTTVNNFRTTSSTLTTRIRAASLCSNSVWVLYRKHVLHCCCNCCSFVAHQKPAFQSAGVTVWVCIRFEFEIWSVNNLPSSEDCSTDYCQPVWKRLWLRQPCWLLTIYSN